MKFFKRVSTVYYRFGTDDRFTAWVRVFRLGWMTAEKKKDINNNAWRNSKIASGCILFQRYYYYYF